MKRNYYAIYDFLVKKSNPGYGFCNSKSAIAFSSKEKRKIFIEGRQKFDLSCKEISRKKAMRYLESVYGQRDMGLHIDNADGMEMVVLRPSVW